MSTVKQRQYDPLTGRFLKNTMISQGNQAEAYSESLEKAQPVLAAMVALYDAETDELGKNKIMQGLCQLAFWLWGWNVTTFHENFSRCRAGMNPLA